MGKSKGRSKFLKTLRQGHAAGKRPVGRVDSDDPGDSDFSGDEEAESESDGSNGACAKDLDPAVELRKRQQRDASAKYRRAPV